MMDNFNQRPSYYVLEYSPSQRAWHIEHIEDLIQANLMTYLDQDRSQDFMLMGIGRTHEELLQFQEEITKTYIKLHPEEDPTAPPKTRMSLWAKIKKFFGSQSSTT
jgi:hypothetical protein